MFSATTVDADFSGNSLENVTNVKCLNSLDKLNLNRNKIKYISNDTFTNMTYLRILDLSENVLMTLEPNTTTIAYGNIFHVDISNNMLDSFDITNAFRIGPYCKLSSKASNIEKFVNKTNFTINENEKYGHGQLLFDQGTVFDFRVFHAMGVQQISELRNVIKGNIIPDNVSARCDCFLVPVLEHFGVHEHLLESLNANFMCESPERNRGLNLSDLIRRQYYSDLSCEMPDCPFGCKCIDKQFEKIVSVKCIGIDTLPDDIPVGYWSYTDLELCINASTLTDLGNREYLSRVKNLVLVNIELTQLDPAAILLLKGATIDIRSQLLESLPVQIFDLDRTKILFGPSPVICNCENLWVGEWIRTKGGPGILMCNTDTAIVDAFSVTSESIQCIDEDSDLGTLAYSLGTMSVFIAVFSILAFCFRYELLIMKRRRFDRICDGNLPIFVSFNDNDEGCNGANLDNLAKKELINEPTPNGDKKQQRRNLDRPLEMRKRRRELLHHRRPQNWIDNVHNFVLYELSERFDDYTRDYYLPLLDADVGEDRDTLTLDKLEQCDKYVVVLSKRYMEDRDCRFEFDAMWKKFVKDPQKDIIISSYDTLKTSEVKDRRLKAFLRVHDDINYLNRDGKIFTRLDRRLGQRVLSRNKPSTAYMRSYSQSPEVPPFSLVSSALDGLSTPDSLVYNVRFSRNVREASNTRNLSF